MNIAVRALLVLSVLTVLSSAAWAQLSPLKLHGVPGPISGAGLPVVLVIGYGAYWLARRNRKQSRD
jgi:hypothetical protein